MDRGFLKKEDVIKLLESISDREDGYIEKEKLLISIKELDIYVDEDIKDSPNSRKKGRDDVYHISDHLQAINKYHQEVKAGLRKSYIHLHMESHFKQTINKNNLKISSIGGAMRITEKGKDSYLPTSKAEELKKSDIVMTEQELMTILNISKGTVNTWKKKGIIKQYRKRIQVVINDTIYKYRGFWLKYYDLQDIKNVLKDLKH